jgi:hypothetical protein
MNARLSATLALLVALAAPAAAQLATGVNYNATNPAPPVGSRNVHWQNDGGRPTVNASAYVVFPTIQVACPAGGDLSGPVAAAFAALSGSSGGIIDARACTAATTWTAATSITQANTVLLLPCATLTTSSTFSVTAGTRNVVIHGCGFQGGSAASGTAGGTVWLYTGSADAFSIGDPTHAVSTPYFMADNLNINTAGAGAAAVALHFYTAQEIRLDNLSINGDGGTGQTGTLLDGTGNYSGGTFIDVHTQQFAHPWVMTGHLSGVVVDDYANASTFIKAHIDCPTSAGSPIAGTVGFDIQGGDGNTWAGGDVEGCATVMHLGAAATSNTVVGLRSENSTAQFIADTGSSFNSVTMGGTIFTGQLSDAGSRNSFNDAFHRTTNGMNGDWYASQQDATLVNHQRLGTGAGHERGLQTEIQTDFGYRWLYGFSDATAGEQFWQLQDLLNNVLRISVGQYNNGSGGTNDQTNISSAGTGAVLINGAANSGTGGVVFNSGGASPTLVADIDGSGNQDLLGQLNFWAGSTEAWQFECNSASVCQLRNANATVPMSIFISYVNGGTELDSQATAAVVINNHSTAGTGGFTVYEGGANYNTAAFRVDSSGNSTTTNNHVVTNHLNQAATADFAGHCSMSGTTSCTISFQHSWTNIPACGVSAQFALSGRVYYTWATNVVTVHSTSNETGQFAAICAGDPN